jgi:hypothetical protein
MYASDVRYSQLMSSRSELGARQRQAIELLLDGASKKGVATTLHVHRNSILNWLREPAFRLELARRSDERLAEVKMRRAIMTTRMVDKLAALARQALDAAEQDPLGRRAQSAARAWCAMYRELRREELAGAG